MKITAKSSVVVLGLAINLMFPLIGQASKPNPQFLVTKIVKAGLGCNPVTEKTWLFFDGTRWNCKVSGEDISIEIYPAAQWKRIQSAVCPPNYGFIAVTDNKTWVVIPESRITALKLVKALGGTLKVFCDAKHIKNEVKAGSPKPSSSSSSASKPAISPSPKSSPAAILGSELNPFPLGSKIVTTRFSILVKSFISEATQQACNEVYSAGYTTAICKSSNGVDQVDPTRVDKYIGFTLDITNLGNEADFATHSAIYSVFRPEEDFYSSQLFTGYPMDQLLKEVKSGEMITVTIYFREPIDTYSSKIKLKLEFDGKESYFKTS